MTSSAAIASPLEIAAEVAGHVRAFVEGLGHKRGLHTAAQAFGGTERRARALLYQEARRIEAHELLRLRKAALELDLHRLEALERQAAVLRARLGMVAE